MARGGAGRTESPPLLGSSAWHDAPTGEDEINEVVEEEREAEEEEEAEYEEGEAEDDEDETG